MNQMTNEAYANENRMLMERVAELTEVIEKAEKALACCEFWGEVEQVRLRLRTVAYEKEIDYHPKNLSWRNGCTVSGFETVVNEISKVVEKNQQGVAGKLEEAKQRVSERTAAAPPMEHTQSRSSGHSR